MKFLHSSIFWELIIYYISVYGQQEFYHSLYNKVINALEKETDGSGEATKWRLLESTTDILSTIPIKIKEAHSFQLRAVVRKLPIQSDGDRQVFKRFMDECMTCK